MPKALDLSGKVYGRLTLIERVKIGGKKESYWLCACSCGSSPCIKRQSAITTGGTSSCGCLLKKNCIKNLTEFNKSTKTHGMTGSPTYFTWTRMKDRCYNVKNEHYNKYGGRGILVCDRWLHSFENFLEDMGEKPAGLSISRKNTNLGYSPENCEWADGYTQSRETRKMSKEATSRFKGVCWNKRVGKFEAYLNHKGVRYHLGYSADERGLAERYDQKVIELTGGDDGTNKKLGLL